MPGAATTTEPLAPSGEGGGAEQPPARRPPPTPLAMDKLSVTIIGARLAGLIASRGFRFPSAGRRFGGSRAARVASYALRRLRSWLCAQWRALSTSAGPTSGA